MPSDLSTSDCITGTKSKYFFLHIFKKMQYLYEGTKIMKENCQKKFSGERAEYFSHDVRYVNCTFLDGESPLKHGKNLLLEQTNFNYKYPLWNSENATVKKSIFHDLSRSGLWYTKNTTIEDTIIEAPKEFRRCDGVFLKKVTFSNAEETLWNCRNIRLEQVYAKGDYFAMNSENFKAEDFVLDGNYFLDGGKNIEIRNARLNSKDSFWNCENVEIYDSYICGEYLGWNSKNLKFVNCVIESNQGLCYIDGLTLENCSLINTDLAFEYSQNINATITNKVDSIKNPGSGIINADGIGTLIMNPLRVDVTKTQIICKNIEKKYSEDPNLNER